MDAISSNHRRQVPGLGRRDPTPYHAAEYEYDDAPPLLSPKNSLKFLLSTSHHRSHSLIAASRLSDEIVPVMASREGEGIRVRRYIAL